MTLMICGDWLERFHPRVADINRKATEDDALAALRGDANHGWLTGLDLKCDESGAHLIIVAGVGGQLEALDLAAITSRDRVGARIVDEIVMIADESMWPRRETFELDLDLRKLTARDNNTISAESNPIDDDGLAPLETSSPPDVTCTQRDGHIAKGLTPILARRLPVLPANRPHVRASFRIDVDTQRPSVC